MQVPQHAKLIRGFDETAYRLRVATRWRGTRAWSVRGLGDDDQELSAHLRSRHETGALLRESGVPDSAEMRLPGRAWLQFEVASDPHGTLIYQTAVFDPIGLPGRLYWYGIYPLQVLIFRGMLYKIAQCAAAGAAVGAVERAEPTAGFTC